MIKFSRQEQQSSRHELHFSYNRKMWLHMRETLRTICKKLYCPLFIINALNMWHTENVSRMGTHGPYFDALINTTKIARNQSVCQNVATDCMRHHDQSTRCCSLTCRAASRRIAHRRQSVKTMDGPPLFAVLLVVRQRLDDEFVQNMSHNGWQRLRSTT